MIIKSKPNTQRVSRHGGRGNTRRTNTRSHGR
jgi:hypothetical protein